MALRTAKDDKPPSNAGRRRRPGGTARALERAGAPGAAHLRIGPASITATLLASLLGLAVPLAALQIYDRIIPNAGYHTLTVLGLGLVCVTLCEFFLRTSQSYLMSMRALRYCNALQLEAFDRMLRSDDPSARAASTSEMVDRFNAVDRLSDYFSGRSRLALIEMPFSLLFLAMIAIIGGFLVLAPIAFLAIFFALTMLLARRSRKLGGERDKQDLKTYDFVSEIFGGAHTVRSMALEALMLRRFERLLKTTSVQRKNSVIIAGDVQRFSGMFGSLSAVATLSFGAVMVINGDLTVGGLAACSLFAGRAVQPVVRAASAAQDSQKAGLAIEEVRNLFTTAAVGARNLPPAPFRAPGLSASRLRLETDGRTVTADAAFDVEPGALALVVDGGDGSAERLLRQIAGLEPLHPDSSLRIGSRTPQIYRRARNGRLVFWSNDHEPFSGTILENLTLFGRGASVSDAVWSTRLLGVDAEIDLLTEGYDTKLASGADESLSIGFLQALMLARALAQKPKMLLLNRPFVSIEPERASRLVAALHEVRDNTTILVNPGARVDAAQFDLVLSIEDGDVRTLSPFAVRDSHVGDARAGSSPVTSAQNAQPRVRELRLGGAS